jgi:DNA-binding SARP family transcriptional activator
MDTPGNIEVERLRWEDPDAWPDPSSETAILLVDACDRTAREVDEAIRRLDGPSGIVILTGADAADAVHVQVGTQDLHLPRFGLTVPAPTTTTADVGPGKQPAADTTPALRLLGTIRYTAADVSPQQLSLLAYLATHGPAPADAIRDALWAVRAPSHKRFLNAVHELRQEVGAQVFPPAGQDGRYRLAGITSDVDLAERLLAGVDDDREQALRAFLELVEGPPFTYDVRNRRHFRWVDLENHASRWEGLIVDAAADLSTLALERDDTGLSRWAIERGLLASPANERLTEALAATYIQAGNEGAARTVLNAYRRVSEDLELDDDGPARPSKVS